MSIWIGLALFCVLQLALLGALGLSGRLTSHDLPETMVTLALLESSEQWQRQSKALAAQLLWTDREMVRTIQLVDATPNGALEQICTAFCEKHRDFSYCKLSDIANIFASSENLQKKDCISSKKQV